MRKVFLASLLAFALVLGTCDLVYANDAEKIQIITEIGSLSNNDNYNSALEKANEALKKYPDEADLYYWRGTSLYSLGRKQEALKDLNKALEINPNETTYLVMRGICRSELMDADGAIADFNKAIEINPKLPSAYLMRASLKLAAGEYESANQDLDTANKLFEIESVQEPSK